MQSTFALEEPEDSSATWLYKDKTIQTEHTYIQSLALSDVSETKARFCQIICKDQFSADQRSLLHVTLCAIPYASGLPKTDFKSKREIALKNKLLNISF